MEFLKDLVPILRRRSGLNFHVIIVSITEMLGKRRIKKERNLSSYGDVELMIWMSSSEPNIRSLQKIGTQKPLDLNLTLQQVKPSKKHSFLQNQLNSQSSIKTSSVTKQSTCILPLTTKKLRILKELVTTSFTPVLSKLTPTRNKSSVKSFSVTKSPEAKSFSNLETTQDRKMMVTA